MKKLLGVLVILSFFGCSSNIPKKRSISSLNSNPNLDYDLLSALMSKDQEKTDELIKAGANINDQAIANDFVSLASSLGISLSEDEYNSKIDKIEFMLNNGVSINSYSLTGDGDKETALTALLGSECNDVLISSVKYLLNKGINPSLKNTIYRRSTDNQRVIHWGNYTALSKINSLSFEGFKQKNCRDKIRNLLMDAKWQ